MRITITITITTISSIYIDEYLFKMKAKDEDFGNVMLILHGLENSYNYITYIVRLRLLLEPWAESFGRI